MNPPNQRLQGVQRTRIVLCMGSYCNQGKQAEPLEALLKRYLGERRPVFRLKPDEIAWEVANCVNMCGAGPNVIVYPGNEHYHHVDVTRLEQIIQTLLSQEKPSSG